MTPVKSTGFSTIAEETEDEVASTDQPGQSERGDDPSEASREEHAKNESTYKTAEKLTPNGDADEHGKWNLLRIHLEFFGHPLKQVSCRLC